MNEFCEGIENLTKECTTYQKVSLGFKDNINGLLFTNKGQYKIPEWHYHVGMPLTAAHSELIKYNIAETELTIDLKPFNPQKLRDYLLGPELVKRLFAESLDNQLLDKPNEKKMKI